MRFLIPAVALLGLTTGRARADVRAAAAVLDRYVAAMTEMTALLRGVKDRATATTARPRVVKLAGTLSDCKAELAKLQVPPADQERLSKQREKETAPFDDEFVRLSLIPGAFAVFADLPVFKDIAESYELEAQLRALKIDVTLSAYWVEHRKYPPDLKEGFKALKRDPPKDPWGREYSYDPAGPRNRAVGAKGDRPDVWVISPYGDGKKLLGNWEEKK